MEWILELPQPLQTKLQVLISRNPGSEVIMSELHGHLVHGTNGGDHKRIKVEEPASAPTVELNGSPIIDIDHAIDPQTVIFEIQLVSFQSPFRKKLNLTFHLIEKQQTPIPVLSIVNPITNVPELSLINLATSIKLCILLPILNNSTNFKKKMIVNICFWMNDDLQSDPIICQINLDLIKKMLVKLGKLPANIDTQFPNHVEEANSLDLNPIQETIIDYFTRQFKLCGINLINYLPGSTVFKNKYTLNTDHAIAVTRQDNSTLIICEAYKGSKEGCLLFLSQNDVNPAYMIFAFKKPILVFEVSQIETASYSNITRITFSLNLTLKNEPKPIEFSMIDQKFFSIVDEYMKSNDIPDESFAEELREKQEKSDTKTQGGASTVPDGTAQLMGKPNGELDSEDEDDDDFNENNLEEDSEAAEEFDSDIENTDDEGIHHKATEEEDIE